MANPNKDGFHGRDASSGEDDRRDPVTAQPVSGMEAQTTHANTNISKELEIKQSKTSSTVSLDRNSTHDREKDLPAGTSIEKEPAVIDAERDPNIVDWDGETDPENPLNWSARKKWYANLLEQSHTTLILCQAEHWSPIDPHPPYATRIIFLCAWRTTRDARLQLNI